MSSSASEQNAPVDPGFAVQPASATDRYFDYCLEPYKPRRPFTGRIRGENLFLHSLVHAGCAPALAPMVEAIQASVGRDMTVWGVKFDGERLWWELYFYDPQKQDANATISALAGTIAPWLQLASSVKSALRESVPYMMVSFDVSAETVARGSIEELNFYLTGSKEHAGRSFVLDASGWQLHNTYKFMEPKRDIDELLPLVKSSVFVDYDQDPSVLARVVIPQLFACKRVCVSKKRECDAVYYSGIDVDQLLWFLAHFRYPAPLVDFITARRTELDHLFFDVGVDYRQLADGTIVYPKTSYYGTL